MFNTNTMLCMPDDVRLKFPFIIRPIQFKNFLFTWNLLGLTDIKKLAVIKKPG